MIFFLLVNDPLLLKKWLSKFVSSNNVNIFFVRGRVFLHFIFFYFFNKTNNNNFFKKYQTKRKWAQSNTSGLCETGVSKYFLHEESHCIKIKNDTSNYNAINIKTKFHFESVEKRTALVSSSSYMVRKSASSLDNDRKNLSKYSFCKILRQMNHENFFYKLNIS